VFICGHLRLICKIPFVFYKDAHRIYRVSELDALPWLVHGFGTRWSDIPALFGNLATVRQVHSAECVAPEGRAGVVGQADALVEDTPGAVVAVKTADCVPIVLVDERRRAVAAVHAGWRGTAAAIVARAVAAMRARFGTAAEDLYAAIGPAIGVCCYEVGSEVAAEFGMEGRVHLDLAAENRRQLLNAGLASGRIYLSGLCTMCHPEEWHSFRRDREAAGRQYSFVGIRQPARE
jgi:polyphenol oxidase